MSQKQLKIPVDDLYQTASEFKAVGEESRKHIGRLEKAMHALEREWDAASKQVFYKNYEEWRTHMQGFSALLENIAREINAIADRFEREDR